MNGGNPLEGFDTLLGCMAALLLITVPLAVWKLVDLVIWALAHLHWN